MSKDKSNLEQDYDATVKLIKQKIAEAATAFADAAKLAESIDEDISAMYLPDVDGEYQERAISPLFDQMENVGWSTSSLSC